MSIHLENILLLTNLLYIVPFGEITEQCEGQFFLNLEHDFFGFSLYYSLNKAKRRQLKKLTNKKSLACILVVHLKSLI
jgi:hypothetical protein